MKKYRKTHITSIWFVFIDGLLNSFRMNKENNNVNKDIIQDVTGVSWLIDQ